MNRISFCILLFLVSFSCANPKSNGISVRFEEFKTNSKANLRGLFVISENVIWASGSEGTILRSVDGGKTWNVFQVPEASSNDFRSLHAWDENRALAFGIAGPDFGYLTEDGGENWTVVFRDTTKGIFFNSLKFANENIGLAVSDPIGGKPFVIKTTDGGNTWNRVQNFPDSKNGEANFAASNTCIEFLPSGKAWIATGGSTARVFYSEDFGENWKVSETPLIQGGASSGIFSVSFKNDLEGVIVGGTYDKPELNENIAAYTNNGGKTWFLPERMPKEYRSCVQLVTDKKESFYFTIGKTGCDISSDDGKSWEFMTNTNYYTFHQVPDYAIGFVAGSEGRIAKVIMDFY